MTLYVPIGFSAAKDMSLQEIVINASRPRGAMRIGFLNLMPDKLATERQFASILDSQDRDIQLIPIRFETHTTKHCPIEYMESVYLPFTRDLIRSLDGLVVTGAPLELLEYIDVDYWQEFEELLEFVKITDISTLFICWSAQAALHHFYGVPVLKLEEKLFGVFPQKVRSPEHDLARGLKDGFSTPVSRFTTIRDSDLDSGYNLEVVASCPVTGPALVADKNHNLTYMFNHLEYGDETLYEEYVRDAALNPQAQLPCNYFPNGYDGIRKNRWHEASSAFFEKWVSSAELASNFRKSMLLFGSIAA